METYVDHSISHKQEIEPEVLPESITSRQLILIDERKKYT